MSPSTQHVDAMPPIATLRRLTMAIAVLDIILMPDPEYRYYRFDSRWDSGEQLASMDNGSGDDWFLLFSSKGAILKGFAHEMPLAKDKSFCERMKAMVPTSFASFLRESAFHPEYATFCLWREHSDDQWNVVVPSNGHVSATRDGSVELLDILSGNPQSYQKFAEDYYECELFLEAIQAIYEHTPLEVKLLGELNPQRSLDDIRADVTHIGYPDKRNG